MLEFDFVRVFDCPSVEAYWSAYFSEALQAKIDDNAKISKSEVLTFDDQEDVLLRVIRKVPERQLPGFLKKFAKGELSFTQTQRFYKKENRIDIAVQPSLFEGKSEIVGDYTVGVVGPNQVKRRYKGNIKFDVKLIGGRIEKWVREDLGKSIESAADITQAWIAEHNP